MPEPKMLLGVPTFSEGIMRALGLKGDLPRELHPLFNLGFQVTDLSTDEYAWTRRTTLWEFGVTVAPVVGQLSRAVFMTRVGSASQRLVLAIVDEIEVTTPTAGGTGVQVALTFLGSGIADPTVDASRRDDRLLGRGTNAFSVNGAAAAGNPIAANPSRVYILAQNALINIKGPWILTNNDNGVFRAGLLVIGTTGNIDLRVNFKWRERDLLPEEA